MRVGKQRCDVTRILIGSVFSDERLDWLVGNMREYQENHEVNSIFLLFSNYFREIFYKSNRASYIQVCIAVSHSPTDSLRD